jgi:hypothetical protein
MFRHHDVSQLTTAELERAKRELQANLGLITHIPRTRADPSPDGAKSKRSLRNVLRARISAEAQPCLLSRSA